MDEPPASATITESGLKCEDLPPTPEPFGWQDSIEDPNKIINTFFFDPSDPNKIIYMVNGDLSGYNKVFFYNVPSKQTTYVCTPGKYAPQINSKGWLTFSDVENNIFIIKGHKDSIVQLTNDKRSHDPEWDYTGNYIYYYAEPLLTISPKLKKIDTKGNVVGGLDAEMPYFACFKKSERLITFETNNSICKLKLRDVGSPANDRVLISGPLYSKPGQINFDDLTLDNTDENFYWSNSNGIFRCNIASLKVDTVFKNCPNLIYINPVVSYKTNELTYCVQTITPINSIRLLRQFKTMNLNVATGEIYEIKITF